MKLDLANVSDSFNRAVNAAIKYSEDHQAVVIAGASLTVLGGLMLWRSSSNNKPRTVDLGVGSIDRKAAGKKWDDYAAAYTKGKEQERGKVSAGEIVDTSKTAALVDDFYSFVTDLYEWGWGTSFHFAPRLPGRDWMASEVAAETRIAALLQLRPGMKVLDAGCGVGGPMRTICGVSGAEITGVTINAYQVQRATAHNVKHGYDKLCKVQQGDFLKLDFPDNTFDAVYAIEATCHAPQLEIVYKELFRVLKPGGRFVSQEWVSTKLFDATNEEHVRIIEEINFGNGLPNMRTWKQAEEAGKGVGFKLLVSYDQATACPATEPWYHRLSKRCLWIDEWLVKVVTFLRIAPKTLLDVHTMLLNVAHSLTAGGETGVFTPMHILVFEKPAH